MTPHVRGTSLDTQARCAKEVIDYLTSWYSGKHYDWPQDVIAINGGDATKVYGLRK